jgi:hypothetical protein
MAGRINRLKKEGASAQEIAKCNPSYNMLLAITDHAKKYHCEI